MTDEAKALVDRLRDDLPQTLIEKHWVDDHDAIYKQREEAADLIETQAREIERLRGLFENAKYEAKAMMEEIERLRAEINSYLEMTGKVTDA